MKKTVVAAAACAAASMACAQSSVTLFGLLDAGIVYTTGSGPCAAQSPVVVLTSPNSASTGTEFGFRTAF